MSLDDVVYVRRAVLVEMTRAFLLDIDKNRKPGEVGMAHSDVDGAKNAQLVCLLEQAILTL